MAAPTGPERVAKLEASGVITGYHAAVAAAALGLGVTALVGVLPADHSDPDRVVDPVRGPGAGADRASPPAEPPAHSP